VAFLPDHWILILPCSRHGEVRVQQRLRPVEQFPSTTCGNDGEAAADRAAKIPGGPGAQIPDALAEASELGPAGRRRHTYVAKRGGVPAALIQPKGMTACCRRSVSNAGKAL
jgi:hypothetical protein